MLATRKHICCILAIYANRYSSGNDEGIDLPFAAGEFGIVYRAHLTTFIQRKTECKIVAVKTIKGEDMINLPQ